VRDGSAIIAKLGGRRHAKGWYFRCPCHSDRKPSASLYINTGIVECFAGCPREEVEAKLDELGLVDDGVAVRSRKRADDDKLPPPDSTIIDRWLFSKRIEGSIVERYLHGRGIYAVVYNTLRFAPFEIHPISRNDCPAMVAPIFARVWGERLIGVHLTFLLDGARRLGPTNAVIRDERRTLGTPGHSAVWLAAPIDGEIGLAEGVETALSAMLVTHIPCWAALGTKRLDKVDMPRGIKRVHLFGDNDQPGRDAMQRAIRRYTGDGLHVKVWWPPEGLGDFNDLLKLQAQPKPQRVAV
jgi:putative DNA primase/helicase